MAFKELPTSLFFLHNSKNKIKLGNSAEMSGAELSSAESAAPKWPSPAIKRIFGSDSKEIARKPISMKFRDFSSRNVERYLSNIENEFDHFTFNDYADVNKFSECLNTFLHTILKKYFPFRTKSISCRRLEAPWITSRILKCIKRKHRWYRMAKSNLISVDSYKKCCKALKNLLKLAKSEYYLHKFTSLGNNPKKNWNVLNKLLNKRPKSISCKFNINGNNVDKPQEIASHFNEFFVNHPISIQNNIQPSNNNYLHLIKPP